MNAIFSVIFTEYPPESVNLTVKSINDTTLHLSWTRPEGTVLFYEITINYTITGASETLSVEENVTMLFYTLSVVHPDLNNITISIVAINAAGAGPPTTILHIRKQRTCTYRTNTTLNTTMCTCLTFLIIIVTTIT